MDKANRHQKVIMFPLLLLLITLLILIFGSDLSIDLATSISQLDEGWSIQYGNNTYSNVTLPEFTFGKLKKGDLIIISNTIPAQDVYAPTLMFKSLSSTVDVMVDGKYIYSYGHIFDDKGRLIP